MHLPVDADGQTSFVKTIINKEELLFGRHDV
jgi:hypothetical protein